MTTRPLFALVLLFGFVFTGCEVPTSPLNEASSPAAPSITESVSDIAGPLSAGKGGHADLSKEMNQLLAQIRSATAGFHRIEVAEEAGYVATPVCAVNPFGLGAMGVHYINGSLRAGTEAGTFDPLRPEVLVYEPQEDGRMRLVAVEYLIFKAAWEAAGHGVGDIPMLLEQEFVKSFGPAAHGEADHYELHVWLWRNNPSGLFAQWNPMVSCPV